MVVPKLPAVFTGTGDLFASLLLVWRQKHPENLKLACEKTMSSVQAVLHETLQEAQSKFVTHQVLHVLALQINYRNVKCLFRKSWGREDT